MASVAMSDAARGCPSGLAPAAPADAPRADPAAFVRRDATGADALDLLIEGAKCANCIRRIEGELGAMAGVERARLNLSTGRLSVAWRPGAQRADAIVAKLTQLGYGATAFDPAAGARQVDHEGRALLRALAVAGFASMNIMMFSVPVWSGHGEMGDGTRTLLHWVSAVVAVPAALYAGQTFFRSAWTALTHGRANMDVPISLGVLLTLSISLFETATRGPHAYFDGACMLLFLLLIGRYLDHRLRERARTAARDVLALQATTAARVDAQGRLVSVSARDLAIGDLVHLAAGDRAPTDGIVERGASAFDVSMLTGETAAAAAAPGAMVHAGAINLEAPLTMRVTATLESSAVAELARLIEAGEQGRARYVRLADRAAKLYVPVVHTLAAATLIGWLAAPIFGLAEIGLHGAVLNAVAVLIITCPCALGLAVPAVQIVATGRLFKTGVLVKSGDALERLAEIDTVIFDKTGTLTRGKPRLETALEPNVLSAAAALARASRHQLARALVEAAGPGAPTQDALEIAGDGVEGVFEGRRARLGRRAFAAPHAQASADDALELWFALGEDAPQRITFRDALRSDAAVVIKALRARGIDVELMSGDRPSAVAAAAEAACIARWRGDARPADKTARIAQLRAQGRRVLMAGDGLNDAAALAAAHASVTPGTAIEASQAAADMVLQGERLWPLIEAIDVARASRRLVVQNLAFSALYNFVAIPIAVLGFVTPLIAALAMSGSSLVVTLNALRLQGRRAWTS